MTRVLALADHSKIGYITQRRFAKVGTKTHPQRGAALDPVGFHRNRLSETPKFARGASGRVAAPGRARPRLPTTADRSARRGCQLSFAFRHRAERSTVPATAWR